MTSPYAVLWKTCQNYYKHFHCAHVSFVTAGEHNGGRLKRSISLRNNPGYELFTGIFGSPYKFRYYASSVWRRPSVRPFICPVFFLMLIERAALTQRNSPGGSKRRGQHRFPQQYYEDGHTCWLIFRCALSPLHLECPSSVRIVLSFACTYHTRKAFHASPFVAFVNDKFSHCACA